MNLKKRAKQLKQDLPAIFLLMKDPKTPRLAKILAGFVIFYALSPIDLIPDFIPVLGYLDDLIILPALIVLIVRLIPSELMENARQKSATLWENGKPKKWYYALPIVFFWLLLLFFLFRLIWH